MDTERAQSCRGIGWTSNEEAEKKVVELDGAKPRGLPGDVHRAWSRALFTEGAAERAPERRRDGQGVKTDREPRVTMTEGDDARGWLPVPEPSVLAGEGLLRAVYRGQWIASPAAASPSGRPGQATEADMRRKMNSDGS
ncbi:hypothetical protein Dimus_036773 [Dionaea muscipula]